MTARIITGDCLNILPTLDRSSIDAVISDPPYGMGWDTASARFSGGTVERGIGRSNWGDIVEDDQPFDPSPWLDFPHVVLWGANHYAQRLPVGTTLVWVKRNDGAFGSFLSDAEIGWQKGGHGVYCHREAGGNGVRAAEAGGSCAHPTQKPLSLMAWCIERLKLPEGATILDPYCGSGTTGVAATRLGFNFIGIEIDPEYAEVARKRIEGDQPLFRSVSQ